MPEGESTLAHYLHTPRAQAVGGWGLRLWAQKGAGAFNSERVSVVVPSIKISAKRRPLYRMSVLYTYLRDVSHKYKVFSADCGK